MLLLVNRMRVMYSDAQLFCKELLERERERARRQRGKSPPLDPVSSSRVPNAASEPPYKTRYESPMFACAFTQSSRQSQLLALLLHHSSLIGSARQSSSPLLLLALSQLRLVC